MNMNVKELEKKYYNYGMKKRSAWTYANALKKFCIDSETTPDKLAAMQPREIYDITEAFIRRNRDLLSPKYMNVVYSSVKTWAHLNKIIESRKQFREIKFEKQSRSTRDAPLMDKDTIRKMCNNADMREKLVVAFYAIYGVRPSLIARMQIGDIYHKDIDASGNNGEIKLSSRVWVLVKKEYSGNKARIDFPIILSSETSKWLEDYLNQRKRDGDLLEPTAPLIVVGSENNVARIIRKLYHDVGYKGRPYLLRHFGTKILNRAYDNNELVEWMVGHKGRVSAIYDHTHTLADWEIENYKKEMINEKELFIYGISQAQEDVIRTKIETIKTLIKDFDPTDIERLKQALDTGTMTFEEFNTELNKLTQAAMAKQNEKQFEQMFLKMNNKYNGNGNGNENGATSSS